MKKARLIELIGKRLEVIEKIREEIEMAIEMFDSDIEQENGQISHDTLVSISNNLITTGLICDRIKSTLVLNA